MAKVAEGQQVNSGGLLPKTGSLQPEWRRCGKPQVPVRPRDPAWPLLVPALARGRPAMPTIRSM